MTFAGKHVPAATACTAYCLPAAAPGIGTWLRSQSCRLAKQLSAPVPLPTSEALIELHPVE
jgi:hypothetical protein